MPDAARQAIRAAPPSPTPPPASAAARATKPKPLRPFTKAEIEEFYRRLSASRPIPQTELEFINPYTLLVAVVLSAQATDVGVNRATPALFAIADTPQKMLELGEERLKEFIRTIGLFRTKASNIIKLSRILVDDYGGEVPRERETLEKLPGVGRKTANVVLKSRSAADDRGRYPYFPRRQPHRHRARQDAAGGRARSRSRDPGAIQARRASLADPARPLCVQGAEARVSGLRLADLCRYGDKTPPAELAAERGQAATAKKLHQPAPRRGREVREIARYIAGAAEQLWGEAPEIFCSAAAFPCTAAANSLFATASHAETPVKSNPWRNRRQKFPVGRELQEYGPSGGYASASTLTPRAASMISRQVSSSIGTPSLGAAPRGWRVPDRRGSARARRAGAGGEEVM